MVKSGPETDSHLHLTLINNCQHFYYYYLRHFKKKFFPQKEKRIRPKEQWVRVWTLDHDLHQLYLLYKMLLSWTTKLHWPQSKPKGLKLSTLSWRCCSFPFQPSSLLLVYSALWGEPSWMKRWNLKKLHEHHRHRAVQLHLWNPTSVQGPSQILMTSFGIHSVMMMMMMMNIFTNPLRCELVVSHVIKLQPDLFFRNHHIIVINVRETWADYVLSARQRRATAT